MKIQEIKIDGKKVKVAFERTKEGLWVHYQGETYFVERSKSLQRRKREERAGGDIVAPMPGKITQVLVHEGQEVLPKQNLIVMEAMKMEYNLRAELPAKVKRVYCAENEQVSQDQLLVEFEKNES